jgi:AcrR family transcriptional regulator
MHPPQSRRRCAHPSGDDREQAILATAERLLEERPLTDISVDDLAKGAGLSRPTFYFYFPSKTAVLLTLLDLMVSEANTALEKLADNPSVDRDIMWRTGINVFFETLGSHKGVTQSGWLATATNAEVRQLWSAAMKKWITHTTSVIEAERARGVAPETLPARELATTLNLLNERALLASFAAEQPAIPEARVLDTLEHIWVSSIYGATRRPAVTYPALGHPPTLRRDLTGCKTRIGQMAVALGVIASQLSFSRQRARVAVGRRSQHRLVSKDFRSHFESLAPWL